MGFGTTLGRSGQQRMQGQTLYAGKARRGKPSAGRRPARVEELESRRLLDGASDTVGSEFWVAFQPNASDSSAQEFVYLSSELQAHVTVSIPGMAWAQVFVVSPGQVTKVEVPSDAYASSSDGVSAVGIHVTADQEISVYGESRASDSTDGFTALPVDVLGTWYMAVAYTPSVPGSGACNSQLAVVATENGTNVTITPAVDAGARTALVPYVVTLARGDVYQLQCAGTGMNYDLTGSLIQADRPIAVFSGNDRASVPATVAAPEHLIEQLVPIENWGDHFVTAPLFGRVNGDRFRVLAADGDTEVTINGLLGPTLGASGYYDWTATDPQEITTSKPVTLVQYANSCEADQQGADYGDPFMAIIPPVELSLSSYTVLARTMGYEDYINVWAREGTAVLLDGTTIPVGMYTPVGSGGYLVASKRVNPGPHTITGSAPVGVMVYGWGRPGSYGFVGGQNFNPSVPVAGMDLEPAEAEQVVGKSHQVTVLAMDDAGQPVADAWIHFRVAGANPTGLTSVNAFSGADGRATFSYVGAKWGMDTVTARITDVGASGTVKWHSVPVVASSGITVDYETLYSDAVSATNADGDSVTYSLVSPAEHGDIVLQADGSFTYMPDSGYMGPDRFVFRAVDRVAQSNVANVSITVLPPNNPPIVADQSFSIPEHCPLGTQVGVVQASDPDGNALAFAILDGDPNGVFAIDAATGLIQVMRPQYLDYETMPRSYDLTVEVTDNGIPALSTQATVTVNILDIDESKTGFDLSNTSIPEHQPAGTAIGDLLASNPNVQSSMVYTLVPGPGSNDNATFSIVDRKLVANISFDYTVRTSYRIRIRGTDGMTVFMEKAFTINVTNINEAPAAIDLSNVSVPEDQQIGTLVGVLSASSDIPDDVFTYSLVDGDGSGSNHYFRIEGDRLLTAATFNYSSGLKYGIRIGVSNSYSLSVSRSFVIGVTPLLEFGKVDNKTRSVTKKEADRDAVTFKLSGGGLGAINGSEISLIGTTAKSVLSISVKKGKSGGDGLYTLTGLASDGLLKGISAKGVVLSGPVQINCLNQAPGKTVMSMKLKQISDADICVQRMPVSSIAIGGSVTGSRISTTGSIGKFAATTLMHSDILVGVAAEFEGQFATAAGDFANPLARLGSLTISGKKLTKGQSYPAYVSGVHISAPSIGTLKLANADAAAGSAQAHVLADTGTLTITGLNPLMGGVSVLAAGTWKPGTAGRPAIWEVV